MAEHGIDWDLLISIAGDILAFQVIPHITSLTAQILISKEQYTWYFSSVRRPFWDIFGKRMNLVFAILHTFVGAASYLIYQSQSSWFNPVTPLVVCGVQILFDFAWRPLYFNQKDWPQALRHSVVCTLLSSSLYWSYHRVDYRAGCLFLPYTLWWYYLTSVVWYVRLTNDPPEPWRRLSFGGSILRRRTTSLPVPIDIASSSWLDWLTDSLSSLTRRATEYRDSLIEGVRLIEDT